MRASTVLPTARTHRRFTRRGARVAAHPAALLMLLLSAAPALAQPVSFNTTLIAHEPMTTASDISASGDLVFVGRELQGVSIVDVSNTQNPTILTTWNHPTTQILVRDVRPIGTTLWCTNERFGEFGTFGLDISIPASPSLLVELQPPTFPSRVHNLWPDGTDLYLSGTFGPSGDFIVDVANPLAPSVRAVIDRDVHDNCVVGDSLYYAAGWEALYLFDVTNPDMPVEIGAYSSSSVDTIYYAHNAYPIPGSPYVVLTEEIQKPIAEPSVPGSTRLVDFSNPSSPVAVWRYKSESQKTNPLVGPHNAYVVGGYLYLSHYQDGLKIFDVSVPNDPVEVAFYDTYPDLPDDLFQGCWGVYPFQGNDRIFLSDRTYGFFHVAFNGAHRSQVSGRVRNASTMLPIQGAIFESTTAGRTTATDPNGDYVFKTGSGLHQIVVRAASFAPQAFALDLADDGAITHDVFLVQTAVDVPAVAQPPGLSLRITPNPTPGATAFRFEVPSGGAGEPTEIGVYDVAGRLVRALTPDTGVREVTWDGRSSAGFRVSAGVYLVSLRIGADTVTERLVIER